MSQQQGSYVTEFHEYANLFPMMNPEEFKVLVQDMIASGFDPSSPIVTFQNKILDGRNRFKAALEAKVKPLFESFTGSDPLGFVVRHNLKRRHLNDSQRAAVAAKLATMRQGERTDLQPSANFPKVSQSQAAEMLNVSDRSLRMFNAVAERMPELVPLIEKGELTVNKAWTEVRRKEVIANLENVEVLETKELQGVYDVIVIDPPWPMEKIERDVAPNQVAFEYPTMSVDEISRLEIPLADDCHVWLWTTQKFLPQAFGLFAAWDVKYICTFNWHKAGGFQPFGLPQYNNEFVLYGHVGAPIFTSTKDFKTSFEGKRGKHSEKPEEFYDMVRRVTAGRRLDMFNRRQIEGFDGWGKEAVYVSK